MRNAAVTNSQSRAAVLAFVDDWWWIASVDTLSWYARFLLRVESGVACMVSMTQRQRTMIGSVNGAAPASVGRQP
jgi:hypothetical protein